MSRESSMQSNKSSGSSQNSDEDSSMEAGGTTSEDEDDELGDLTAATIINPVGNSVGLTSTSLSRRSSGFSLRGSTGKKPHQDLEDVSFEVTAYATGEANGRFGQTGLINACTASFKKASS